MEVPEIYKWLLEVKEPPMLVEALKLYGTKEYEGPPSNPEILEWAKEVGVDHRYKADSRAWCALFMAVVAKRCGYDIPADPLAALNWLNWGYFVDKPEVGDILIFRRAKCHGHIAIYVGEDETHYHILGGNQAAEDGDEVNIQRRLKSKFLAAKRPTKPEQKIEYEASQN